MIEELSMGVSTEAVQSSTRVYRRELPGAGYVAIDITRSRDLTDDEAEIVQTCTRVYVERRASEERRLGHEPPVVAEFAGDSGPEVGELYRMAADNAALARALLAWQARHRRRATAD